MTVCRDQGLTIGDIEFLVVNNFDDEKRSELFQQFYQKELKSLSTKMTQNYQFFVNDWTLCDKFEQGIGMLVDSIRQESGEKFQNI